MRLTLPTALLLLALLTGGRAGADHLRVVATVPDLAAIANEVGGGVRVSSLLLPTQDPHFADARPHLALELNRARLLLLVGLDVEVGWLPTLLTGSRNPAIQKGTDGYLDASTRVLVKEVPRERVDRSMGDVHPGGNPHYLLDVENASRVARAIAERMGHLEPTGQGRYRTNADRLAQRLAAARRLWTQRLAGLKGTPVVTYHRSLIYLTDLLGLRIAAQLEPKPGIPPNAAHVLQVIQIIRAQKVPLIMQEEYYPDRTAQLVAQKTGARLVLLPGGADFRGGERFDARLERTVQRILEGLRSSRSPHPTSGAR